LSAAIAAEALRRPEDADEMVALVTAGRAELSAGLAALGWETQPSVCNFVLGRVGPGAAEVAESLMWEQGLVVRSFHPGSRLEDHLRVTVRTPADHERLLAALGRRA
jgi:histidinol-phosphate/aromatic aminotransferase/cobyric acid decarboxylase-like protein